MRETEEPRIQEVVPDFGLQDVAEFQQRLGLTVQKIQFYENIIKRLALRGDRLAAITALEVGLLKADDIPSTLRVLTAEERQGIGAPAPGGASLKGGRDEPVPPRR